MFLDDRIFPSKTILLVTEVKDDVYDGPNASVGIKKGSSGKILYL
jgi:hypothetical protein